MYNCNIVFANIQYTLRKKVCGMGVKNVRFFSFVVGKKSTFHFLRGRKILFFGLLFNLV